MITFLLGLPGSGKSYYAVDRIYNNFSIDEKAKKDKKVTFQNCYTNINEFNYDKVENTYRLDFDKFYFILERLHKLYKAKKPDKYLVRFLSKVKLKDTLFVIDEAHNHFDKKDLVLVWWLSYHRHLFHEIILITQNLALIESKYKSFSEFFYVAKPQSLTLFKSHFKYNIYCSSRLSKASHSGATKVKRRQEVFALYHSGDSINSSNVILKYLLISLSVLVFLFGFIYYNYIYDSSPDVETSLEVQENDNDLAAQNKTSLAAAKDEIIEEEEITDYSDSKYFMLSCTMSKCTNENIIIPPQLLRVFIDKKDITVLYTEKKRKYLVNYYLFSSKEFHTFIKIHKKGEYNEDDKGDSNLNIFGNSDTPSK